jgi:hypothetical protein
MSDGRSGSGVRNIDSKARVVESFVCLLDAPEILLTFLKDSMSFNPSECGWEKKSSGRRDFSLSMKQ